MDMNGVCHIVFCGQLEARFRGQTVVSITCPGSLLAKPCKWAFSHTYKTIASIFKLYQFDYAIWCERSEFLIVEKFLLLDFVKYLQKLPGIFVEER